MGEGEDDDGADDDDNGGGGAKITRLEGGPPGVGAQGLFQKGVGESLGIGHPLRDPSENGHSPSPIDYHTPSRGLPSHPLVSCGHVRSRGHPWSTRLEKMFHDLACSPLEPAHGVSRLDGLPFRWSPAWMFFTIVEKVKLLRRSFL